MQTQELKLSQLRIDGGTQPRVAINEEAVTDYAERLRENVVLPPVVAFFDGIVYWLADGFHRYHAHRRAGREAIAVDVHDGGLREAILHSVGANTDHGLRRTNEDKRKAVETLLTHEIASKDENGNPWNNCDLARRCHVDEKMVRRLREILTSAKPRLEKTDKVAYTTKHGTKATMKTSNLGKRKNKRSEPPRHGKLKPSVAKLGHSLPNPMIQVNLPPKNPKAAAAGIAALFTKEFIQQFIVELSVYVNENTPLSGEQA